MESRIPIHTAKKKTVQPYILRESAHELAETAVVADYANAKSVKVTTTIRCTTNQQAEHMHNAHNGRVQLIIIQAVYTKNGNISVKHRSKESERRESRHKHVQ